MLQVTRTGFGSARKRFSRRSSPPAAPVPGRVRRPPTPKGPTTRTRPADEPGACDAPPETADAGRGVRPPGRRAAPTRLLGLLGLDFVERGRVARLDLDGLTGLVA